MRRSAALVVTALLFALPASVLAAPKDEEVARARILDQQGVRAYKDGRYNDAIKYFSEAFKLGGPPSELWNIAKCHMRLDQPDQASDAYDRYLMQPGLTPQDKSEAREELEELRRRRSILTVASAPSHGTVYLDGKHGEAAGTTPFSVQVPPGTHKVEIEQKGYRTFSQDVEAKFGRAIIVDAQLEKDPTQPVIPDKPPPPGVPAAPRTPKRFTLMGDFGLVFSKLGTYSEGARLGATLGATYWLLDTDPWAAGVGLLFTVASDSWGNTIGAPTTGPGCTATITATESSTELAGFGVGEFAYRFTDKFRVGGDAGLGLAGYTAGAVGGDLFYPTCQPSPGAQVAAHLGVEASYTIIPLLRAIVTPLALQIHPSYSGARPNPVDATGAWLRIGIGLSLAVDL